MWPVTAEPKKSQVNTKLQAQNKQIRDTKTKVWSSSSACLFYHE